MGGQQSVDGVPAFIPLLHPNDMDQYKQDVCQHV